VKPLRIGSRRSALAIVQAELVRDAMLAGGTEAEIVPMTTSGDQGAGASSSPQGLKGLWIDSILDALETGEIDLAVHSAKDLPADDEDGFTLGAVPQRADPFDVIVTRSEGLPPRAVIGTSAIRRRAQLLASFPGLEVVELRGNVDTRLAKLEAGDVDAAVLAAAGLERLGIAPAHARRLPLEQMVPAPGQGCLAVQCRDDDERTLEALRPLDHPPSHAALDAERSLMWRLGGGCALPLGAHADVDSLGSIRMTALVATPEGAHVIRVEAEGSDPETVAGLAARALIERGAEDVLAEVGGA
jgi:hydroxymethylbilane synthase